MYFTFEHECDNLPMTLTIYVEYSIWTWPGTYDQPAELDVKDVKYTVMCGRLEMTEFFKSCTDSKITEAIEEAVTEAIWNNYFNM
jgi:hypothetical protein